LVLFESLGGGGYIFMISNAGSEGFGSYKG
jgi:hypothetical protein